MTKTFWPNNFDQHNFDQTMTPPNWPKDCDQKIWTNKLQIFGDKQIFDPQKMSTLKKIPPKKLWPKKIYPQKIDQKMLTKKYGPKYFNQQIWTKKLWVDWWGFEPGSALTWGMTPASYLACKIFKASCGGHFGFQHTQKLISNPL